ncbi:BLUF domain-containing protein [Gammaproteobacteria bacterium LSUCC0112]|nr:BLUF domain-containing protein [Gammaproteobacteria bacterium LSUCC0112]
MIQLIYYSSASQPLSKDDLMEILQKSRENNKRENITGILLYKDGSIMQVLEGEAADVEHRYNIICADHRHKDIFMVGETEIEERQFAEWSMGFRDLTDPDLKTLEGFNQYLNKSLSLQDFAKNMGAARELVQIFATGGM